MIQETVEGGLGDWFDALPYAAKVLAVLVVLLLAHSVARLIRRIGERLAWQGEPVPVGRGRFEVRSPKVATVSSLVVSALVFGSYFLAFGFAIGGLTPITLNQYLASATVIGLAVGFGTQGLVQDVVSGLTLIFSDAIDIGDLVEVSGQVGRVEKIGLRFTTLTNFMGQTIIIPNRNIGQIGRFRRGYARAYLDIQLPDQVDDASATDRIARLAHAAREQYASVIVGEPRVHPIQRAGEAGWRYLRVRFRFWPGQQQVIESAVRQRAIAAIQSLDPSYPDWMVTVTYGIVDAQRSAPAEARELH